MLPVNPQPGNSAIFPRGSLDKARAIDAAEEWRGQAITSDGCADRGEVRRPSMYAIYVCCCALAHPRRVGVPETFPRLKQGRPAYKVLFELHFFVRGSLDVAVASCDPHGPPCFVCLARAESSPHIHLAKIGRKTFFDSKKLVSLEHVVYRRMVYVRRRECCR